MRKRNIAVLLLAALLLAASSIFIVRADQTAILLQFGRIVQSGYQPGLHFKLPLVQEVRKFDRRILTFGSQPERYLTSEKKDVSVDFFAIGKIENVRDFYRATGGDESIATQRLAPIIKEALRNEINAHTLQEVVSGDRDKVLEGQLVTINKGAAVLGVKIFDIRIKRIDLPAGGEVIAQLADQHRRRAHRVVVDAAPDPRDEQPLTR